MTKAVKARIVLDYEKDVFRDLILPINASFEEFHKEILKSFDFPNNQMTSFYLSNENWDKGDEIPLFDMNEEFGPKSMATMAEIALQDKIEEPGARLVYVYDFFLMWCFFVEIIEFLETDEELPQLATKFGEAPDSMDKEPDLTFEVDGGLDEGEDDEEDDIFGEFQDGFNEEDFH